MIFSKGISHMETKIVLRLFHLTILDFSKAKESADDNFKFDENGRKFSNRVENTVGKRTNCLLRAVSPLLHCRKYCAITEKMLVMLHHFILFP